MKKNYDVIIFDLDGTLLDTSQGILGAIRHAQESLNLDPLPESTLRKFFGPPVISSYMEHFGLTEEQARQATIHHRAYQAGPGAHQAEPFQKMPQLLAALKKSGYKLAVATLKREDVAIKTLEAMGIADYFDTIGGIDDAETLTKADIINMVLKRLDRTNTAGILIGDSLYDAQGAWSAAVTFIAAVYGFGFKSADDAKKYNPLCCVNSVDDIASFFGVTI